MLSLSPARLSPAGILSNYLFLQLIVWWLCHIVSLFALIFYPVRAKNLMNSKRVRCLHISVAIMGMVLPSLSPLASIISGVVKDGSPGYRALIYPPNSCSATQRDIQLYTFALPLSFMVSAGVTCLLLIFWKLYKQRLGDKYQLKTAEKKILASLCYFTLLQFSASTLSTYYGLKVQEHVLNLQLFFQCTRLYRESCEKPPEVYSPLSAIFAWALNAALPFFLLVYVVNFEKLQMLKEKCCSRIRKQKKGSENLEPKVSP